MKNIIFSIMVFSMLLNIGTGLVSIAIPTFNNDPSTQGTLTYDDEYQNTFDGLKTNVTPAGVLEDEGNSIYRVLDTLNLGFIQKFINTITQYTHGFIVFLDQSFGSYLDPAVYSFLFGKVGGVPVGALYDILTIGYIFGAWWLWTGKDLSES